MGLISYDNEARIPLYARTPQSCKSASVSLGRFEAYLAAVSSSFALVALTTGPHTFSYPIVVVAAAG